MNMDRSLAEIGNWVDKLIKINITDQASKESKMIETQYGITEELIDESGGLEGKTIVFVVYPRREGQPEGSGEGVLYQGTVSDVRPVVRSAPVDGSGWVKRADGTQIQMVNNQP